MRTVTCRCGEVAIAVAGEPFLAATCHCDDCQAGSRQLEALPGAPPILGPGEGSAYAMIRRDHLRVLRGAGRLEAHVLKPGSTSRRVASSCCATPLYLDVAPAHWISTYVDTFRPGLAPDVRVMTRFAPPGSLPDDGVPRYKGFALPFVGRILRAWVPMLLTRRPRLTWPPRDAAS